MHYYVYDFILNSPCDFQELMPASENSKADIFLEIGQVPKVLFNPALENKPFVSFNKKEYLIEIPQIGKIYTTEGIKAILEPKSNQSLEKLKLFFLENGLASLMQQRDELVMQTSGLILENGHVWLFASYIGFGKSSLAFILNQTRKYKLFTDNTCILRFADNQWLAIPAFPFMQLNKKVLETFLNEPIEFKTIIEGIRKVGFEFKTDFSVEARKISGIIILDANKDNQEIKSQLLELKNATADLSNYVYFGMWQVKMQSILPNLQKLNSLAASTKIFQLSFKNISHNLTEISNSVNKLISNNE